MLTLTHYSPTEHLAQALMLGRWADTIMIPLTSYFDETGSSTDIEQPINGMAGFIGPASAWIEFEKEWSASSIVRDFHDKNIRKLSRKEKARKVGLSILEKYPLSPIGWMVDMDKWREWACTAPSIVEIEPYYSAFGFCLRAAKLRVPFGLSFEEMPIIAVFDENVSFAEDAIKYYRQVRKRFGVHLAAPPVFQSSDGFAPLRAADCIAGILRDQLKSQLTNELPVELESFGRIMDLAKLRWDDNDHDIIPPLRLISDEATIRRYLRDDYGEPY